jgi:ferredoxin--NADP+ reductase
MYTILEKRRLAHGIQEYTVEAPLVARAAKAGQFVVIRLHQRGERIPITLADWDPDRGTITLVVQAVGKTTVELEECFQEGDALADVVGPLGEPSEIEDYGRVVCVAGGVGIAPIHPVARALKEAGNEVICIAGARNQGLLFWLDRLSQVCHELIVTTDDGSYGRKGLVTEPLKELVGAGRVDRVWAIGPAVMMKFCSLVCQEAGVPIIVSLNPIMVDGTGMCGACRVEVDGQVRFGCVDGPEFPGDKVNWDLLIARLSAFKEEERCALERYRELLKEATA